MTKDEMKMQIARETKVYKSQKSIRMDWNGRRIVVSKCGSVKRYIGVLPNSVAWHGMLTAAFYPESLK